MVHQVTVLQEIKRPKKHVIKEINSDLIIGCNNCMHALLLSHAVYCALRREKISGDTCKGCPHFDPEPLEYKLFRRM